MRESSAGQSDVNRGATGAPNRNLVYAATELSSALTSGPISGRLHGGDPRGEIFGGHYGRLLCASVYGPVITLE